ncbi:MAG TPA: response regulator [Opitutaceae bacterium]|nr:response regulator [Opitutaceae bacterium]
MAQILLIDDDDGVRSLMRLALVGSGHTVIEASDGEEGLQLFPQANADLVITDMVMPGKDGAEVLTELQKMHPPVKVIAISGGSRHGFADNHEVAERLGAAKVLAKPFSCAALLAAIDEVLPGGGGKGRLPGLSA